MKKLINPKTENYFKLKEFVLSEDFPWHFNGEVVDEPSEGNQNSGNWSYSHSILNRPEINLYHFSAVLQHELFVNTISEIFDYNQIPNYLFLRMAVNSTHPVTSTESRIGYYHSDHDYKHENFILYMTPTDGATMIEGVPYTPTEEDECITFSGTHATQFPTYGRRVILVATYISLETDLSYKERCAQLQALS